MHENHCVGCQRQITLRILEYHFSSRLTAALNLCHIYLKITRALAILLEHMHKKFKINRTKIKGGCQSGRKVVTTILRVICLQLAKIRLGLTKIKVGHNKAVLVSISINEVFLFLQIEILSHATLMWTSYTVDINPSHVQWNY